MQIYIFSKKLAVEKYIFSIFKISWCTRFYKDFVLSLRIIDKQLSSLCTT